MFVLGNMTSLGRYIYALLVSLCVYIWIYEPALSSCSDDPVKCDQYWFGKNPRRMFACRVLLGEIKVSIRKVAKQQLKWVGEGLGSKASNRVELLNKL